MTNVQLVLLASALLLIALLVWQKRARRRDQEGIATLARAGEPYHCVAIKARGVPCAAARELIGRRLLSREAPKLAGSGLHLGRMPLQLCPLRRSAR